MHYSTVKPSCSNFRVITANFSGVRIRQIFSIFFYIQPLTECEMYSNTTEYSVRSPLLNTSIESSKFRAKTEVTANKTSSVELRAFSEEGISTNYSSLRIYPEFESRLDCRNPVRLNPYKPGVLFLGHKQTVQTQIRRRRTWRLIRVYTVRSQEFLSKIW